MNTKGFTLIEVLIVLAIVMILAGLVSNTVVNNKGATADRAKKNADLFVANNNMDAMRTSCAGDSNQDGYGTCTVVLRDGKRIQLQCPTDFFDVKFFNATECKEVFQDMQFAQ